MAVGDERLAIPPQEYERRESRLRKRLVAEGNDAMVVFKPVRISYLCGFFHASTERPVVLVVPVEGASALLVPQLESEHAAQQCPQLGVIRDYPEYPTGGSGKHPMEWLRRLLVDLGCSEGRVAADRDGYEDRWGYRGPDLADVLERSVRLRPGWIDDARSVKSPAEIALIEEACSWGDRAHEILAERLTAGVDELLASHASSLQATREMLDALGPRYVPTSRGGLPAQAMFIRGANTAHPHGLHATGGVAAGDILVTGAFAVIGGYESELERTMVVGEPSSDVQRYFDAMVTAQDTAFRALRPGRTCAEVERDVRQVIEHELGMLDYVRHHTGHAFGMEGHEHPFLDLGDATLIEEGMVFSLEPGLYVPGFAGFRHSDTVLVTRDGCRSLCGFPRDLPSLTVEA